MLSLSNILAVAIGIVFVFLLLSLLTTWIQELIATLLSMRSKHLANILQNMFDPDAEKLQGVKKLEETWSDGALQDEAAKLSENAVKAFYEQPVIKSLSEPNKLPSYISPRDFTMALLDLLSKAGSGDPTQAEITLADIRQGIERIQYTALKERLVTLVESAEIMEDKVESEIIAIRDSVECWFNSTMDRATGWYKRDISKIGLIVGILVAILFNADTLSIAQALWRNAALRETVTASAIAFIEQGDEIKAEDAREQLESLGLPIGWTLQLADIDPETPDDPRDFPRTADGWLWKLVGLLITGFAISRGAPIWFDLLTRLTNIRGSGGKPAASTKGAA